MIEGIKCGYPRPGVVNDAHFGFVFMFTSVHFFYIFYIFSFEDD